MSVFAKPIDGVGIKLEFSFDEEPGASSISTTDCGQVSDGYHTFDELYDHRTHLFAALVSCLVNNDYIIPGDDPDQKCQIYKSNFHQDGSSYDGMFLVLIVLPNGKQISYHCEDKYWYWFPVDDYTDMYEDLPEFDGHSPDDVLERIRDEFLDLQEF